MGAYMNNWPRAGVFCSPRPGTTDQSESLAKMDPPTLRLKIAAAVAYPDASMTASGVRKEAARRRPLIERTANTAAIQSAAAALTYRKLNKPAPGPLDDSLDDLQASEAGR
jgi:hypothetical protein